MSLIALAEFKSFIHMQAAEIFDDILLQEIIDGEEAEVSTYMNQDLNQVLGEVEYHDGNRDNTVLLNHGLVTATPVVDIDSNGDYTYATNLVDITDFVWYPNGIIQLRAGYFHVQKKLIRVTYNHGYASSIPVAPLPLPTNIGFTVYKNRAVKICGGYYTGLVGVTQLRGGPGGAGAIYTESNDYAVMDDTGEVVLIETGVIADGALVYADVAPAGGTYTSYSNLPLDLRNALKKKMSNTYQSSHHVIEQEGEAKEFNEKYIYMVFDKYARLSI